MFFLRKPSEARIARFVAEQKREPLSYREVGASRARTPPRGYAANRGRVRLGRGEETYCRATHAVQRWAMYDMEWIRILWTDTPIEAGRTVGLLVRHYGFWSLNACRIVYVIDEREGVVRRYGFGYGTLSEHGERGEERFTVEWRREDESVWYELFSFSRPGPLLSWIGYPFNRALQKRFARESLRAMAEACP
ncbi:MAG: DUF1990 domain-containing protein [Gemmatimonadota bacterium]|nr:DUF1990 domain-containing protein [Gemmatimonadota bacterium]